VKQISQVTERTVEVPWSAWHDETSLKLDFPTGWQVEVCNPAGADPLGSDDIAEALSRPHGALPLEQAAADCRSAAIIVEDITRPTPTAQLLPAVIERLRLAGIELEQVKILIALGAHGTMSSAEVELKLGSFDNRIEVIQHDPEGDLVRVGETRRKTQIHVNSYFAQADFRISLGTILPHPFAAFSGGAKLVMPGLSGLSALERNHSFPRLGLGGPPGQLEQNGIRADMEEAAEMARLDWIADCLVNTQRQVVGIHCGAPQSAHRKGCQEALRIYRTEIPEEPADVIVLNAFPKDTELLQIGNAFNVLRSSERSPVRAEGIVVICAACPRGIGVHLLFQHGGPLYTPPPERYFRDGRRLALVSPGISEKDFLRHYGSEDLFFSDWAKLRDYLNKKFSSGAKALIFPAASLQIVRQ